MTIRRKIILAVSLVAGIVFAGFGFFVYYQIHSIYLEKIDIRLESLVEKLEDEIDEQMDNHRFPNDNHFHKIVANQLPLSVFRLADSSGVTIYADTIFRAAAEMPFGSLAMRKQVLSDAWLYGSHYRTIIKHVRIEKRQWTIEAATPLIHLDATLDYLRYILWTTIPFVVTLIAISVYLIVRKSFRPLASMIRTSNAVSVSTLHERILFPQTKDEVADLGVSLNRMIERLEVAFKNQRQFIADASHELRTPMTIIQSELEFATRSSLPRAAEASIQIALDELDHLRVLASDLLTMTKIDMHNSDDSFRTVHLDELLTECIQRIFRTAQEKDITVEFKKTAAAVYGNAEQLQSAFLNVLENAVKYTPSNGSIAVALSLCDKIISLSFRDSGIGIAAEDLPNIFQPFYRSAASRADHSGSGLGLSIVKRIVELHRGSIQVESNIGAGSLFTITFPRYDKS